MAKSTRSKVKRHFRAQKREIGIYAATEAARVQRLSSKLAAIRDAPKPERKDEGVEDDQEPGSLWLLFGLLDPQCITAEHMWSLENLVYFS